MKTTSHPHFSFCSSLTSQDLHSILLPPLHASPCYLGDLPKIQMQSHHSPDQSPSVACRSSPIASWCIDSSTLCEQVPSPSVTSSPNSPRTAALQHWVTDGSPSTLLIHVSELPEITLPFYFTLQIWPTFQILSTGPLSENPLDRGVLDCLLEAPAVHFSAWSPDFWLVEIMPKPWVVLD